MFNGDCMHKSFCDRRTEHHSHIVCLENIDRLKLTDAPNCSCLVTKTTFGLLIYSH